MKFLTAISAAAALKLSHKSTQPSCDELLFGFEMMFEMMDGDGNGAISADEAIAFGIPPGEVEMLGMFDEDMNGELSKDELTPLVNMALADYGCEGI